MTIPLEGVIRDSAWGSRTAIQSMLGQEPDGRPAAELWFGAHPLDPSQAEGTTLDKLIAADPATTLGTAAVDQFGPHLPYLLKVLAADKALSMQVHPNREQARAGCAAEDAAGLARGAPQRNYPDANHKPELVCALSPFEALCGFAPVTDTLALLDDLAVPELGFVADLLRGPDGLRRAFTALLRYPEPRLLADAVAARAEPAGPLRAAFVAAHDFPGDIGVVLTVLLNYVRLEPGEAIYLGAGNIHCYLRGLAVEIMANSDNVLRCGLTPKHVDVAEVLRVADCTGLRDPRWQAEDGVFTVPVPDFALRVVDLDAASIEVTGTGPGIVLCVEGRLAANDVGLTPGRAAFVPASVETLSLRGTARAFVASVGPS